MTRGLTPEILLDALFDYLTGERSEATEATRRILLADYLASGARSNPGCLQGLLGERGGPMRQIAPTLTLRQARHEKRAADEEN